ncbi:MAG: hypothetical protein JSR80_06490 [Verrucomicrobia bacterium]|nr:hypothetical protein [Verrucomicrobiota bacterium]
MMEIREKAISFIKNTSYERKAFALFWVAVALQNFPVTRRKLLHFALVTGALGRSVWMVIEAFRQAFNDDEDDEFSEKVAKGLQKRDLATLNLLIERAEPIGGQCALFKEGELSEKDLKFLHNQLSMLDKRLEQLLGPTSYRTESLFSLEKDYNKVISLKIVHASYSWHWQGKTFTRDQYAHLCYGYCQIRDDLFTAVHLESRKRRYGKDEEICQLYSSASQRSAPEEGSTVTYPLPREEELKEPDLHLINRYLEAGGERKLEALPEDRSEELNHLLEAVRRVQQCLDTFPESNTVRREIETGNFLHPQKWVEFFSTSDYKLEGKIYVSFHDLPKNFFLSKEQLKALFLGQIVLHPHSLGIQQEEGNLECLLWKKEELIEASSREQFGRVVELKQDWECLIETIKTGKATRDPSHMHIEAEDEGKGDVVVTFKPTEISGKKYLIIGKQRICFSKENVYNFLVGCRLSGDFPGIEKIIEEEPSVKYRLVKKQRD